MIFRHCTPPRGTRNAESVYCRRMGAWTLAALAGLYVALVWMAGPFTAFLLFLYPVASEVNVP